jgi:hypothetical protein
LGTKFTRASLLAAGAAGLVIAGCGSTGPSGPAKLRASSLLAEQTSSDAVVAEFIVKNLGGSADKISCLTVVATSGSDVGVATIQIPTIQPKGKWQVVRKITLDHPDPDSRSTDMAVTCGHAKTVQFVGLPHVPIAGSPSTTAPKPAAKPRPKAQTFSGNGSTNLGTVTVTAPSTISWTCGGCTTFAMSSFDEATDTDIAIDSQASSGTSAVSPGSYPNVSVVSGGTFSINITPGG